VPKNIAIPFDATNLPDGIPLGNYSPLLVPSAIGQSFLQPKFIYPLGAVSLLNPDNVGFDNEFEPLNNSFDDSPFFDHPQQLSTQPEISAPLTNQPNIQAKSLSPQSNSQPTRSPNNFTKTTSIQRKSLVNPQPNRQVSNSSLPSQEFSTNTSLDIDSQSNLSTNASENLPIQRVADLSIIDNGGLEVIPSQQIQRSSDFANAKIPENSFVSNSETIQPIQQIPDSPSAQRSVSEADYIPEIQRKSDLMTPQISVDNFALEVQRKSDLVSPPTFVDTTVSGSDRNLEVQRVTDLSPVSANVSQSDRIPEVQRVADLVNSETLVDNSVLESDRTLEVQRVTDLSPVSADISQNDRNLEIQRKSYLISPETLVDNSILESDRTLEVQRVADLSPVSVDVSQSNRTAEIQRKPDLVNSETLVDNSVVESDRT